MRFLIDTFYLPDKGRLVLASGNRFRHDIPTENIRAFFEELYSYGSYVAKHGVGKNESPSKGHTVLPDR
jgi:hypothetical protein